MLAAFHELHSAEERLTAVDASLPECQDVLGRHALRRQCADAYGKASDKT